MPDRTYADEWLPSRFSLGVLRLLAWAISVGLETRRPASGAYLNRERHQHPLEAYLLAVAYWIIPTLQLTLLALDASGGKWIVAAPVAAVLLVIVPNLWVLLALLMTPLAALISRFTGRPTHDIQALITPTGMLALAIVSVASQWPGAMLGWLWIGLTVIEFVASLVCVALRGRFSALESRLPTEAP